MGLAALNQSTGSLALDTAPVYQPEALAVGRVSSLLPCSVGTQQKEQARRWGKSVPIFRVFEGGIYTQQALGVRGRVMLQQSWWGCPPRTDTLGMGCSSLLVPFNRFNQLSSQDDSCMGMILFSRRKAHFASDR